MRRLILQMSVSIDSFVDEWDMELSNVSFLSDPYEAVKGHAAFKWLEGGAYLIMHKMKES